MTPSEWQSTRAERLLASCYKRIDTSDHMRPMSLLWNGFLERESDKEVVDWVVAKLRGDGWIVKAHQSGVTVFININEPEGPLLPTSRPARGWQPVQA